MYYLANPAWMSSEAKKYVQCADTVLKQSGSQTNTVKLDLNSVMWFIQVTLLFIDYFKKKL